MHWAGAEDNVGMLFSCGGQMGSQDNTKMQRDYFLIYHFTTLLILDVTATCSVTEACNSGLCKASIRRDQLSPIQKTVSNK